MKVLAIDHAVGRSIDRGLYRSLKRVIDGELVVLVPRFWDDSFQSYNAEPGERDFTVDACATFFVGKPHRVLYRGLGRRIAAMKPDILYVNGEPESHVALQATWLRNRLSLRSKVVFNSWRNIEFGPGAYPYRAALVNAWTERFVLKNADHAIVFNETARQLFAKKGFRETTVVPAHVDLSVFTRTDASATKQRLGLSGFVIGFVGRFVNEKGIDTLFEVTRTLPFEHRILLVGAGPAEAEWRANALRLGIAEKVVWIPSAPRNEVPTLLACMDVLVLPSRTTRFWKEQFGRSLIEAMATGVPVVGSDSGEIPNVIGDAGIVFREGSCDELRRSLNDLHDRPALREELAGRGMARVQTHFSIDVVAKQYGFLFRRLAVR